MSWWVRADGTVEDLDGTAPIHEEPEADGGGDE